MRNVLVFFLCELRVSIADRCPFGDKAMQILVVITSVCAHLVAREVRPERETLIHEPRIRIQKNDRPRLTRGDFGMRLSTQETHRWLDGLGRRRKKRHRHVHLP